MSYTCILTSLLDFLSKHFCYFYVQYWLSYPYGFCTPIRIHGKRLNYMIWNSKFNIWVWEQYAGLGKEGEFHMRLYWVSKIMDNYTCFNGLTFAVLIWYVIWCNMNSRLDGPQNWSGHSREETYLLPPGSIRTPSHPANSTVIITDCLHGYFNPEHNLLNHIHIIRAQFFHITIEIFR